VFEPSIITSGAPIPVVAPEDLKRVLRLSREVISKDRTSGQSMAVAVDVIAEICTPGANVGAIFWRCSLLQLAIHQGEFPNFQHDGEVDDVLVNLFATFSFRAVNVQPDGTFQLNRDEFEQELQKLNRAG
jgi:hypothetical protein